MKKFWAAFDDLFESFNDMLENMGGGDSTPDAQGADPIGDGTITTVVEEEVRPDGTKVHRTTTTRVTRRKGPR